ncbi:MAG: hypothetical protein AOA65_2330 [Candidatus Bathyarchaeota archaeon BA1]|nr:MAG: hypothetical protein AOA65_2330 [Candidatus Bathyarchaeota archaeon BA1]
MFGKCVQIPRPRPLLFYRRLFRRRNNELCEGKPQNVYLDGTDFDALKPPREIAEKVAAKYAGKVGIKFTNQRGERVPREKAHFWRIYVTRGALARTIATRKERIKPRTLTTLLRPPFIGDFLADSGMRMGPSSSARGHEYGYRSTNLIYACYGRSITLLNTVGYLTLSPVWYRRVLSG